MTAVRPNYFETGIYSVPEAARLTGVSTWRIRRWLRGYKFRSSNKQRHSPPLWNGQLEPIDSSLSLGFLDLIEIKFVDAFLKTGVSWATLRKAREQAREFLNVSHPFCTNRFATDGQALFVELQKETGQSDLIEILKRQRVFAQIIKPFLKELEFSEGEGLVRWWPMGHNRLVVIDPTRCFGRPVAAKHGVPTEVLAKAAKASSISEVSRWYDVPESEIKDAVEFEQKLAA